jgi:hypothetical protein
MMQRWLLQREFPSLKLSCGHQKHHLGENFKMQCVHYLRPIPLVASGGQF